VTALVGGTTARGDRGGVGGQCLGFRVEAREVGDVVALADHALEEAPRPALRAMVHAEPDRRHRGAVAAHAQSSRRRRAAGSMLATSSGSARRRPSSGVKTSHVPHWSHKVRSVGTGGALLLDGSSDSPVAARKLTWQRGHRAAGNRPNDSFNGVVFRMSHVPRETKLAQMGTENHTPARRYARAGA